MALFKKSSSTIDLREEEFTEAASLKIDEEAGVIRDVKILGRQSKKGHEYSESAIQQAAKLYEGLEVNLNHPKGNASEVRDIADGWGQLKNVHVGTDGAYGDLHYLKEHAQTPVIIERVKRGMRIGLSHNARGNAATRGGKKIVESVAQAYSVDLVSRPATSDSLFESESATVSEIIEANKGSESKALPILEAFVADPMAGQQMAKAPVAMPQQGMQQGIQQGEVQLLAGLKAAMNALMDSGSLTLDEVLDIIKKSVGSEAPKDGEEPDEDEDEKMFTDPEKKKKFEESVSAAVDAKLTPLTEQMATVSKELSARKLLESFNTSPAVVGAEKFKTLLEAADEAAMKTLVESWPPALRGANRPAAQLNGAADKKTPRLIHARR